MKFGKKIQGVAVNSKLLPVEAYMNYKGLKKHLDEASPDEFTTRVLEQIQQVRAEIAAQLTRTSCCSVDIGPCFVAGGKNPTASAPFVDAMYECIELNREGCRKITKKFTKKHPDLGVHQAEKLVMFDAIMKEVVDEVEKWATNIQPTPALSAKAKGAMSSSLLLTILVAVVLVVALQPAPLQVAFGVGLIFSFLTAWGNAANDICNCVGTAVGCKALTLAQAVFCGIFFEVVGCVTLGPFVAKSITKGMIQTEAFEDTPELFGFCMVCVLIGTACSTLLATVYGFPISATHGIIGGLVAAGLAAKGSDSVGWNKLGMVAVSWVVAPLGGALVAIGVYLLIQGSVFSSSNPVKRARMMQPFFLWMCIMVNVLFVFIKGPKSIRVSPLWMAVLLSSAIGLAVVVLVYPIGALLRKTKAGQTPKESTAGAASDDSDEETASKEIAAATDAPAADQGADQAGAPAEEAAAAKGAAETGTPTGGMRGVLSAGLEALGLNEDITANEKQEAPRQFTFRKYEDEDQAKAEEQAEEKSEVQQAEQYFVKLLCISAFSVSIAHGGNDVGNATGPLSALLEVYSTGKVAKVPDIPIWATLYGALGFAIGILTMGRFTIKTVGTKITVLSPSKSFATQIGGAVAVLSASVLGMPVSTSHCLVGAVFGIGLVQKVAGTGTINMKVLSRIFVVWVVTIPLAMLFVVIIFYPFRSFF